MNTEVQLLLPSTRVNNTDIATLLTMSMLTAFKASKTLILSHALPVGVANRQIRAAHETVSYQLCEPWISMKDSITK